MSGQWAKGSAAIRTATSQGAPSATQANSSSLPAAKAVTEVPLPSLDEAHATPSARRQQSNKNGVAPSPQPATTAPPPAAAVPGRPLTAGGSTKTFAASETNFDAFVVLDFEATCEFNVRLPKQEIIEFPLVIVDPKTLKIVAEFQQYVRPVFCPKLTDFCTQLTGITQDVVDRANTFPVVFKAALDWLASGHFGTSIGSDKSYCFVMCGDWDLKTMLPHQLGLVSEDETMRGIKVPDTFHRWINVKTLFPKYFPSQRRIGGMEDMLQLLKVKLDGRHHSGIDDCRNIAKILIEILKKDPKIMPTVGGDGYRVWHGPTELLSVFPASSIVAAQEAPPASKFDDSITKNGPKQAGPSTGEDTKGPSSSSPHERALAHCLASPAPARAMNEQERTSLSKKLSLVLRHRAEEMGVPIDRHGFVYFSDLKQLPMLKFLDLHTLGELVRDCSKQRFRLALDDNGSVMVRANQGHSIQNIDADLKPITSAAQCPVAVHGTYYKAWDLIKSSGGLSRMTRQHIHFAKGLPGDSGVISGMRSSAQVLVYLDVAAAIADGVPLFESENGVILCPGVGSSGMLPLKYVSKVVDCRTKSALSF